METPRPITIAIVYKSGGDIYDHTYVNNIVDSIRFNLDVPHKIVCLTDDNRKLTQEIDELIKFRHNWPKWWGKIELFRRDLFKGEQVFFFDLDTFIVGSLNNIVRFVGSFCALRDFYRPHIMGSGFMSWNGSGVYRIYDEFVQHDRKYINNTPEGDQAFINLYKPCIEYAQDIFPDEIVSYKVHCLRGTQATLPEKAKVVCFHGKPRPHEITTEFKKYWI